MQPFIMAYLLLSLWIFAEEEKSTGFRKDALYFDLARGTSLITTGPLMNNLTEHNRRLFPAFSTPESLFIYQARENDFNKPSLKTKGHKISFEYALTQNIGFGMVIQDFIYEVNNYNTTNLASSLFYAYSEGLVEQGKEEQALSAINAYYLVFKENFKIMGSFHESLHLTYHFRPEKKWDPYIRFKAGGGRTTARTGATIFSLTLGSRFFFHPNFYFVGEIEASRISLYKTSFNYWNAQPPHGDLRLLDISFGIGFSPWDTTGHTPYPKKRIKQEKGTDLKEIIENLEFPPEEKEEYKELITEINKSKGRINVELTVKRGKLAVILLQDAFFSSGDDEPYLSGIRAIKELTKILKNTKYINFRIEGHTDNVQIKRPKTMEKFLNNEKLSFSRAHQVWEIMRKEGFPVDKVSIHGMGDTEPRANNDTESGRSLNRRIEILGDRDLTKHPDITELINR